MSNRRYQTLLLLLLLLHAITVHSFFSQTNDNNAATAVLTTSAMNSKLLACQTSSFRRPLFWHHATHHPRVVGRMSFLPCCCCGQQRHQAHRHHPMMMMMKRQYYSDGNGNNNHYLRGIIRIWPVESASRTTSRQGQYCLFNTSLHSSENGDDFDARLDSTLIDSCSTSAATTTITTAVNSNDEKAVTSNNETSSQSTLNAQTTLNSKGPLLAIDNNEDGTATHWFTFSLPEGYCVGVLSSSSNVVIDDNNDNDDGSLPLEEEGQSFAEEAQSPSSLALEAASQSPSEVLEAASAKAPNHTPTASSIKRLLHPQEYTWGIQNLSSSPEARTSYYLGRVALRLALERLLLDDAADEDDDLSLEESVVSNDDENVMVVSNHENKSNEMVSNDENVMVISDNNKESIASKNENESASKNGSSKTNFSTTLKRRLYNTITCNPIQKDSHGRPILPEMVVGSISHKGGECAVGLAGFHPLFYDGVGIGGGGGLDGGGVNGGVDDVGSSGVVDDVQWREDCPIYYDEEEDDDDCSSNNSASNNNSNNNSRERIGIGVDIEYIDGIRGERIKRRILTENERSELGGLVDKLGISIGEEVMLRFSLKESVYKAMHPILCEYVGFQEAEIKPLPDGTAKVILNLKSGSHKRLGIVVRNASWRRLEGGRFFLTTALVGVDSNT